MKNILFFLTFSLFLLTSCSKDFKGEHADLVGEWYSDYTELVIRKSGLGSYVYEDFGYSESISGRVSIEGDVLKFSFMGIAKKYRIDQAPLTFEGTTWMVLDGEYFVKE